MTTYAENLTKLNNSRAPGPTHYPLYVGANGMAPPYGTTAGVTFAQELSQQGFNCSRSAFTWTSEAPSPGVYDWTKPDNCIFPQVALGIIPIMQDMFTPFWADPVSPPSDKPWADVPLFSDTANWNAWLANRVAFATAGATRYKGKIWWELGNEMNTPGIYWRDGGNSTSTPDINAYGHYFAAVYTAIKAVDPDAKVCVGGLLYLDSHLGAGTDGITYVGLLKTVLDGLGVTPDAVAIHPYILGYTNGNPTLDLYPQPGKNSFGPSIRRFQKKMVSIGWGAIPTWITEFGYNAISANSEGAYNAGSEAQKAAWYRYEFDYIYYNCTKQVLGPNQSGVDVICVYKLENYADAFGDTDTTGLWTGWPIGGPHVQLPAGVALQEFMHLINNGLHVPLLTGMTITGPTAGVMTHGPLTYSVTGTNDAGSSMLPTPTFHTSDPTVATITSVDGATSGTLTIVGPGTCSVWASTYNAKRVPIQTPPKVLTISAQIPTTGTMTPNPFAIAVSTGGTATMTVSYLDQLGGAIIGQPPGTFGSSDPTNAPVDPITGVVTAVGVSTGVVITFTPTTGNACTATGNVTANPVLQITNAPSTLINVGALLLTVTDGTNPVTGCTFVISDGTKATMSGQYLVGAGTSGTFTIKAQKAGYDDSVLSTVTCTGGGIIDDKDVLGLSNGASVSSYTDPDGNVWAQATPPTYAANDYNGHASLVFNGTTQSLQSTAAISRLNGAALTYAKVFTPTSNAPSSNELGFDNRDVTNGQGFVLGRNQVTMAPILDYYTTPTNLQLRFDGSALSQNTQYRQVDRVSSGNQSRWTNGVANGVQATDPTYRNPTTSPPIASKGAGIAGSPTPYFFSAEKLSLEILVNRYVPDSEATQIDQRMQLYIATAGSSVTSVNLFYNSAAAAPMLLFTGTTYTLVAKDQSGNVLSGVGTWSSTDATNAPIGSSSGVIAPAAGIGKTTITYTHTASGHTATVDASILKQPTWLKYDAITYANDAALRANILSSVVTGQNIPAPTGTAGSLYTDGLNEGNLTIDTGKLFMGNQSLLMTIPNGSSTPPQLSAVLPSTYFRIVALTVKQYSNGFTTVGSGGGAASYKDGPFSYNAGQSGRAGILYTNTNGIYVEADLLSGGTQGIGETAIGTVTTEWTDQSWYCDATVYAGVSNLMSIQTWRFKVGTHPLSANLVSNTVLAGPMNPGTSPMAMNYHNPMGQNYNQTPTSTLKKWIGFWGCVDGVTYGDPLGLLQDTTTPTLTGISGGTIAHGTNGATVILTGTNFTSNCYPTFSNAGVLLQSLPVISGGGTTMTLTVNVTAGATTGAGTVSVTNYASQHTTGTQVVTIT